jgi:beta-glucanase (GH16 family)
MRKLFIITLLIASSATYALAQCYNLVWADEFNGTSLDLNNWTHQTGAGGWGNGELQYYTNRTDNSTVDNGTLKIIAKQESYLGSSYTSARIISKNKADFKYGKFEARVKMPSGQGIWPAFWLIPTDEVYGTWPKSGEIDIFELLGHQPNRIYSTVHTQGPISGQSYLSSTSYDLPSGTFASAFHDIKAEWEPNEIRFYVDNVLITTKTPASLAPYAWPFDQYFFNILNVAVGGNWPGAPNGTTVFPQTMEVDYLRVYQKTENIGIVGTAKVEPFSTQTYKAVNGSSATYAWTVPAGATINSGQGTPEISVTWGSVTSSGNVACTISACNVATPALAVEVNPNLFENPSFESDFQYWNQAIGGTAAGTFAINTTTPQHLLKDACMTTTALSSQTYHVQLLKNNIALVAGQSYTIKFWAKADTPNRQSYAAIINNTTYGGIWSMNLTLGTTWQEYVGTFTANANVTGLLTINGGYALGTICVDNFTFGKTSLVLPLRIVDFRAVPSQKSALISWQLEDVADLQNLEIQRSRDGQNFETTHQTSTQQSVFEDQNLKTGKYYYRLKMIQEDGRISYSKIETVTIDGREKVSIFPNPCSDKLEFKGLTQQTTQLYILNQCGIVVLQRTDNALFNTSTIDIHALPNGIYTVLLEHEDGQTQVEKIVKID